MQAPPRAFTLLQLLRPPLRSSKDAKARHVMSEGWLFVKRCYRGLMIGYIGISYGISWALAGATSCLIRYETRVCVSHNTVDETDKRETVRMEDDFLVPGSMQQSARARQGVKCPFWGGQVLITGVSGA